ncbi:Putative tail protein (ACLAME 1) [hydrothermal vent metagenome]|uniref:Tail protein (ACLAME 1) n=1 Tax=hydrothermal vent metagenome TaxID=652676 RepID=A0A3B0V0Z5_9ZZZZ
MGGMSRFFLFTILGICCTNIAFAKSLKVYKYVDKGGITHYSSKKPDVTNFHILNIRCPECAWKNKVNWHNTPLVKNKFEKEIQAAATKWTVEPALIKAIIHAESSFKPKAQSSAGAQGLMQLMPATQKTYAVTNPFNPEQNIQAGTEYFKHLMKTYKNNLKLSLAAYNAGETAVKKYGNNVPPYKETENYIKRVKILHKRYK